jgi:hypothetical protein
MKYEDRFILYPSRLETLREHPFLVNYLSQDLRKNPLQLLFLRVLRVFSFGDGKAERGSLFGLCA